MTRPSSHEVTQLLQAWCNGDQGALDQLIPLIQAELHRLAHHYLARERPGHILQTTALVNEAYRRLIDWHNVQWRNRAHFCGIAAQLMRHILVDYARRQPHIERIGDVQQISLDQALEVSRERRSDLVALDDALRALAVFDPRKSRIVELRFFGGLDLKETAEILQISPNTVTREWNKARAWLYCELSGEKMNDA
jgi:RNA polymerase sigma factor (TIGR02999 family)